jgi:hypothetical protein
LAKLMLVIAGCAFSACETKTQLKGGLDGGDKVDGTVIQGCRNARIPKSHRASGSTCPQERALGISGLGPSCSPDAGGSTTCWQDSDCKAGNNGRCYGGWNRLPCASQCSYDSCSNDFDCPANQPCECRASDFDSTANTCVAGSNCRVDSDCGPCGYCSPSQVNVFCFCPSTALCKDGGGGCYEGTSTGWKEVPCSCGDACGHGYFCHTPNDSCVDDSDCKQGTCNFDTQEKRWSCSSCWPVP